MRQGGALRRAGGARRVLDVDGVVERQGGFARRQVAVFDRRAFLEQRRPGVVEHHRLFQRRARGSDAFDGLHVVAFAEPLRQQQEPHTRLVQRVLQLPRLVGGVHVDENRADARGGVLDDDPLEAVGRPDADPVAALDPPPEERLGEGGGGVPELAVRGPEALRRDHQRLAAAATFDGAAQVLADGLAEQGHGAGAVRVGGPAHGPIMDRGRLDEGVAPAPPGPPCRRRFSGSPATERMRTGTRALDGCPAAGAPSRPCRRATWPRIRKTAAASREGSPAARPIRARAPAGRRSAPRTRRAASTARAGPAGPNRLPSG